MFSNTRSKIVAILRFSGPISTSPQWLGEYGDRNSLLPGGVQVDKYKFTEQYNIRQVSSGVLLGRRANAFQWEPVNNNLNTVLATTVTAALAVGVTILPVATTSGYLDGDVISVAGTNYTIATNGVSDYNSTLTITVGLSAAVAVGASVALAVAVPMDDFYLLAYDIEDANQNPDATLCRHQSLVYYDYLPDYPFTNLPNVLAKIQSLYQTMRAGRGTGTPNPDANY